MLTHNTGLIDRVIRVVIGLALIAAFFIWPELEWRWAFWIGIVPLVTGAVGFCPIYRLFGWSTAEDSKHGGGSTSTA